jgi:hypothetical protein
MDPEGMKAQFTGTNVSKFLGEETYAFLFWSPDLTKT